MKKISKRNIWKLAFAVVLAVVIYLSLSKFHETICTTIDIRIQDSSELNFVDRNDVFSMLHTNGKVIEGHKMDDVDIHKVRDFISSNPYIRKVAIYKTVSGVLKVDIQQRKPLLLVVGNNQEYYIDADGYVFPASSKYPARTLVVTGCVQDKFDFSKHPVYKINSDQGSMTYDLFRLGQLIMADDFWHDQVAQIYVTTLGEYELVPMVGKYILALGSIEDYHKKMYILKQFYLKGLKKTGWNRYSLISVKYSGQIVCRRRIQN